jgi:hypothetical protein
MSEYFISRDETAGDLLASATFIAERIQSKDGHAEAISAVLPLYLQSRDVDLAAELANTVEDPFTRDKLLMLVAEKCAELDDDEYAMQLAETVEDYGMRTKTLERIGVQKASNGQFEKAFEIVNAMDHPDGLLAAIAIRRANDGDGAGADEALRDIEFPVDLAQALLEIAATKVKSGDKDQAVTLLDRAAATAVEIEHSEERIKTLIETGNLFTEAGRRDRAVETLDKARRFAEELDNVHRDSLLASIALSFFHAGSIEFADRALDLVGDKTQIASCLLGYSREYWANGEHGEALDALEEGYAILKSQREAETRSSQARFALFSSIATQFAGFEKGERAIEVAQAIEDENQRIAALSQIAGILTTRKEDEQARHALRALPDDASQAIALILMSDAKAQDGDRDGATVLLDESGHLVDAVPQLLSRSNTYNEIAGRFVALGHNERASEIAELNLEAIATIRDESIKATALANLAAVLKDVPLSESRAELLSSILRRK